MTTLFTKYIEETEIDEQSRRPLGTSMQCQNCIFWSLEEWKQEKKLHAPNPDLPDIWGECRRNAPTPSTDVITKIGDLLGLIAWATEETANIEHSKTSPYDFNSDEDRYNTWFWPKTQPYSWCGEFKLGRKEMSAENIERFERMYEAGMAEPDDDSIEGKLDAIIGKLEA